MAGARFGALVLAAAVLVAVQAGPVPSTSQRIQETKELSKVAQVQLDQAEQRLQQARDALIKQLIVDVAHDQGIRGAVQAVRVEQRLEDEILTAARAARGHPQELQKLDQYVRRDKRALGLITSLLGGAGPVNRGPTYSAYIGGGASAFGPAKPSGGGFLTGILGSSSGLLGSSSGGSSGDGEGSTSPEDELTNGTPPGSDSGSILSLITPILGSLSGSSGGGGGGDSDGEGGGSSGSDSGSILSLVTPLLGSSSGNGYNDVPNTGDDNDGSSGASASASAGSDSGSILSLVTPLLGSSSGGGGGGGGGDEGGDGGASAGGGSDSSAILGLVTPLLGSSSGGSGGSGGGGVSLGGSEGVTEAPAPAAEVPTSPPSSAYPTAAVAAAEASASAVAAAATT